MQARRLGVAPSMHEIIQKLAAPKQRPMTFNEFLKQHTPADAHTKTPEERTEIAKSLAATFQETKPKIDVVNAETLSPEAQFALEHLNTKAEMSRPEARQPVGLLPHGGVESWGPPTEDRPAPLPQREQPPKTDSGVPPVPKRTPLTPLTKKEEKAVDAALLKKFPRTVSDDDVEKWEAKSKFLKENPEAGTGGEIFFPPPNPMPLHELDKRVFADFEMLPQLSDPQRRYLHKDEVARGLALQKHLSGVVGTGEGEFDLDASLKTPYAIHGAAPHVKTQEELQDLQKKLDEHKTSRRKFLHTPTVDVTDQEPRVTSWEDAKRLAELGVPIDAPMSISKGVDGKQVASVQPAYAESARRLAINESAAQKAIDAKQIEFLTRDPEVISLQEANARAEKAHVEGYQRASELHLQNQRSLLEGRDTNEAHLKDLHQTELALQKSKLQEAKTKAFEASQLAHDQRMGTMLGQAGLPPSVLDEIQKQHGDGNPRRRDFFKEHYGKTPALSGADITPTGNLVELSNRPKLIPPVLPKKLPDVPKSDVPIYKEHLGLTPAMSAHDAIVKAHPNAKGMEDAMQSIRGLRDAHLSPAPIPSPAQTPSWGQRFWKGVEGIGDMIPGIHEGSNKYLRRAAGIALPLGVAGGTALLANHYLNKKNEEEPSAEEHQPKKVASLAMFQHAGVR